MNPIDRVLVDLGARGHASVVDAHRAAVAIGGNVTGSTFELESTATTQDLLCAAGDLAVDLAMVAQVFEADPNGITHARLLREAAAGVARLSTRALEVHARDTGYDPDVWIESAVDETETLMADDCDDLFSPARRGGEIVALARVTASELFAALACTPADRMGVPGHISGVMGTSVALFMIASGGCSDV